MEQKEEYTKLMLNCLLTKGNFPSFFFYHFIVQFQEKTLAAVKKKKMFSISSQLRSENQLGKCILFLKQLNPTSFRVNVKAENSHCQKTQGLSSRKEYVAAVWF